MQPAARVRALQLFVVALPSIAHTAGLGDLSSHPSPAIALPVAGERYTDPVFGTTILRVTEELQRFVCVQKMFQTFAHEIVIFSQNNGRQSGISSPHVLTT